MSIQRLLVGLSFAAMTTAAAFAQSSERIRLNQVGYAFGHPKLAISLDTTSTASLIDSASGAQVLSIVPGAVTKWNFNGVIVDTCRILDFTSFDVPGTYLLKVGSQISRPVHIGVNPFDSLSRASLKAYWFQRCSYAPSSPYAGRWARTLGHPDTAVVIHPSAATTARPAGSTIRSPGGWYDAGDYGKYVVNAGISTWTLLHLYQCATSHFDTLQLDEPPHPEKSDLVDEILWELRWMLSMQDPNDGGVYHKLTTLQFSPFEMPSADQATRYVFQKSTQATLDMAAVAAYAARLFQGRSDLPGFSDTCLAAALAAWNWARANPAMYYDQTAIDSAWPSLAENTGAYGDGNASDEFQWAASELFLTTQADSFAVAESLPTAAFKASWGTPDWGDVSTLGWLSLQANPTLLTGSMSGLSGRLDSALLAKATLLRNSRTSNGFDIIATAYDWGSNSAVGNSGLILWKAWVTSQDTSYLDASLDALDYLLGRNATGYCFVTGFGSKSPMHPHHRISASDTVVDPEPGFLVGGPNSTAAASDGQPYPSTIAPMVYVDLQGAYASNEVAINWSAPLAFLAGVWSDQLTQFPSAGIASRTPRAGTDLLIGTRKDGLSVQLAGQSIARAELLGIDGRLLSRVDGPATSLDIRTSAHGLVLVRAQGVDGSHAIGRALLP
jgi:endoglucanase